METFHIPGMAIGVFLEGKPIKIGTYGFADLENRVPIRKNSVFEICSITKQFTAVGLLLLAQEHKLSIDDSVRKYFPEASAKWTPVTLRAMLQHTSGINDDQDDSKLRDLALPELFQKLEDGGLDVPGDQWEYSNIAYYLLGRLIERVSGKNYYEFLRERVFGPLGMKHTGPITRLKIVPHRVHGYSWDPKTHSLSNAEQLEDSEGIGDGGLASTLMDLNRWSESLKVGRLLRPDFRAQMLKVARLRGGEPAWTSMSDVGYGLGVYLGGTPKNRIEKHSGGWSDASVQLTRYLDQGLTVIVLTNLGGWEERPWAGEAIAQLLSKDYPVSRWPTAKDPDPVKTIHVRRCLATLLKMTVPNELVSNRFGALLKANLTSFQEFSSEVQPGLLRFVRRVPQGRNSIFEYRTTEKEPKLVAATFDSSGKISNLEVWNLPFDE